MRRIAVALVNFIIIRFSILFFLLPFFSSVHSQDFSGTWQGKLFFWGKELPVVFHFAKNETNEWTGTTTSPFQTTKKFPIDDIEIDGDSLSLDIYKLHAEYNGRYNKDSAAILGTLKQHGFRFPLNLIKGDATDLLYHRPQKPQKPYPYSEEEVTVINQKDGDTLSGTFTRPFGKGKFPTIVLITGSGPQDRDESLLGHKPFLVLSDYLTRRGFAVLRCDDRGTEKSTGDFEKATSGDFANDVEAEINYLETRKDVNKKKIGLIGHSEGGVIAPLVASRRMDVSFIVLMAGPGINLFDLLLMQDSLVETAEGWLSKKQIREQVATNKTLFHFMQTMKDSAAAVDSMDQYLYSKKESDDKITATIEFLNTPWMRWYINYDPTVALSKLTCPVLAINGEKDVQVPASADLDAIEASLKNSGNKNYEVKMLPGLNHLFQQCTQCSVSEYGKIEQTMDTLALTTIGEWLEKNILKK